MYINGSLISSFNSTVVPLTNVLNTLDFNDGTDNNLMFSKTKYVKVYKSISNAQKDYSFIS